MKLLKPIGILLLLAISFAIGILISDFRRLQTYNRTIPGEAVGDSRVIWSAYRAYLLDRHKPPTDLRTLAENNYLSKDDLRKTTRYNNYFFSESNDPLPQGAIALVAAYQTTAGGHTIIYFIGKDDPIVTDYTKSRY